MELNVFSERINKINHQLSASACLVTGPADLYYLTGVRLEGFILVLTGRGAVIFTSGMLKDQLQKLLPDIRVSAVKSFSDAVIKYCRKNNINMVSFDPQNLSYSFGSKLSKELDLEPSCAVIAQARQKKDAEEIDRLRIAGHIAAECAAYVRSLLQPGRSEEYISLKIEEFFFKKGVRPSFPAIVASGPNSALPHHVVSARKFEASDIVTIDLGCVYKGYSSDLTRTYFLGRINPLQQKVYRLVEDAKAQAVRRIRPGVSASSIDAVARRAIARGGYGKEFLHSTGHGVGIEVHESPRLSARDKTLFEPGMVVTVEPGIYLSGRFGVRLEDTILVTEKGNEVLTI